MAEHSAEFDLLFRVVGGVQEHVSGLREDVVAASDALGSLRDRVDLPTDVNDHVRFASRELDSAIQRLGELQLLLAAAAQTLVARDGARRRIADE